MMRILKGKLQKKNKVQTNLITLFEIRLPKVLVADSWQSSNHTFVIPFFEPLDVFYELA